MLAANERLLVLQKQVQAAKGKEQTPRATDVPPWQIAEPSLHSFSTIDYISQLPSHLGWESDAASQVIRAAISKNNSKSSSVADEQLKTDHPSSRSMSDGSYPGGQPLGVSEQGKAGTQLRLPLHGDTVKHYPSIGIAALKAEQAAIYRVWLMCRYLDVQGCGWLSVLDVQKHFEDPLFLWTQTIVK